MLANRKEKKVTSTGKRPSEMNDTKYQSLSASNWQSQHKNSNYALNDHPSAPVLFHHLLVHARKEIKPCVE